MALVLINESTLKDIANAIRTMNGTTEEIKPQDMAAAITAIKKDNCYKALQVLTEDVDSVTFEDTLDFTNCGITEIGAYFYNYTNSTSGRSYHRKVILPDVEYIKDSAFYGANVDEFYIPKVKSIGNYAFAQNNRLKKMIFPDSCISLGNNSFAKGYTTSLTKLVFGTGFTTIPYGAISGQGSLKKIYFKSVTPPSISSSAFNSGITATVYVPVGTTEAYQAAYSWSTSITFSEMEVADMPYYDEDGHAVWTDEATA